GAGEADVVLGFVLSEEYQAAHSGEDAWLRAVYQDALSRDAEAAGLAFWTNELRTQSRSLRQAADGIVNSDESYLGAIDVYYAVFLHRPGEDTGRQAWFDLLRGGRAVDGPVGVGPGLPNRPGRL